MRVSCAIFEVRPVNIVRLICRGSSRSHRIGRSSSAAIRRRSKGSVRSSKSYINRHAFLDFTTIIHQQQNPLQPSFFLQLSLYQYDQTAAVQRPQTQHEVPLNRRKYHRLRSNSVRHPIHLSTHRPFIHLTFQLQTQRRHCPRGSRNASSSVHLHCHSLPDPWR